MTIFGLIIFSVFSLLGEKVEALDWPMVQRDPFHNAFQPKGPSAPLKQSWRVQADDPEDSFTTWPVVGDGVVFARSGRGIIAVQASSGQRKWYRERMEGSLIVAPVLHEETLITPLPDRLVALSQDSGEEIWAFDAQDDLGLPTLVNGRLFLGSRFPANEWAFYSVDAGSGALLWKVASKYPPDTVPAAAHGKVVVTSNDVHSDHGQVMALDETTGGVVWQVEARATKSSPAILEDKVVFGGGDLFAYALDVNTGNQVWRSSIHGKFDSENAPAIAYGDVFLADRIGNVYRIDGDTGRKKWVWGEVQGLDPGGFGGQFPVIAGKTLYIGNGAGWLYALDVDSGRLLWKHQVGGFVYSGAVDEERFYFGVKFRNEGLYAFEHDPQGKLEPLPSKPSVGANLLSGLAIFGLIVLAVFAAVRYRKSQGR